MNKTVKIDIDTKTFARFLVVISVFTGSVFLLWHLLPILQILAMAIFLAIALNKPVSKLSNYLPKHSRLLAIVLVYVIFITLLYILFSLALPPTITQTSLFIGSIPNLINQMGQKGGVIAEIINRYNLQSEVNAFTQGLQAQIASLAQGVGSNVVVGVSTIIIGIFTMLLVLVLTFLMLVEGPKWVELYWQTYTDHALLQRHQKLVERMYNVVTGYVNGQVLVASLAALLSFLTLVILTITFNLPAIVVLPLAVITFFCELIPIVGATIGGSIVIAVLAFNNVAAALFYLVYFLVYMQIEGNIIQPTVQSRTVEISALTVLVAVITGVLLLGIPGGILAIPVAGCIRVIILDYIEHRRKEKHALQKLSSPSAE